MKRAQLSNLYAAVIPLILISVLLVAGYYALFRAYGSIEMIWVAVDPTGYYRAHCEWRSLHFRVWFKPEWGKNITFPRPDYKPLENLTARPKGPMILYPLGSFTFDWAEQDPVMKYGDIRIPTALYLFRDQHVLPWDLSRLLRMNRTVYQLEVDAPSPFERAFNNRPVLIRRNGDWCVSPLDFLGPGWEGFLREWLRDEGYELPPGFGIWDRLFLFVEGLIAPAPLVVIAAILFLIAGRVFFKEALRW